MERIDIKADYRCNNNCLFCVVDRSQPHTSLSPSEVGKELDNSRRQGAESVAFTGGEPTINPNILSFIKSAKTLGYKEIMLITNGRLLSNFDVAEKLVLAGANKFMFSIHGLNTVHDSLTKVKGSLGQAIEGFKNIKSLKQEIITDTVANSLNYKHLPDIIEYLIKLGSSVCQIDFIIPTGNAWQNREMIPSFDRCIPYIHKTLDLAITGGYDKKITIMGVPYCHMKGYEQYMNEPRIPEIRISSSEPTHATDDYNLRRAEGKLKIEKCRLCENFSRCEGIWENHVKLFGKDIFKVAINDNQ